MTKPHVHAENMALYAQDAAETDTPWERWENNHPSDHCGWKMCVDHPGWSPRAQYRRKPRTISINGIDVPEPVREPLENGQRCFIPEIGGMLLYSLTEWDGGGIDYRLLERGMIHLTKEAAIAHAKALLSFTEKGDE